MEYLAQFTILFLLAWAATHSIRIWANITTALIGWLLIPVIAIILIIGEGAGWHWIGYAMLQTLNLISNAFQSIPIMISGVILGILYGLKIRI